MRARVRLHGTTVGYLELTGDVTVFRFSPEYLTMPVRPVLGRWFEDQLSPELVVKGTRSELPAFFQNYLPEPGSGLRELLARRAGVPANRELPLLCALGEDLAGAATVERLPNENELAEGQAEEPRIDHVPASGPLRFSLAGMQLKFSVLQNGDKFTVPVTGAGGRWILKVPSTTLPVVAQNEYVVMSWARAAGIVVPEVALIELARVEGMPDEVVAVGGQALLVERFDRPRDGGPRIHQEDFAQVLGVRAVDKYGREAGVTYDRLGKIIATVCGQGDFEEFLRRLVFNVLCHNPDAHLKNWSVWYPDPRRPRLSPAYDLVTTTPYPTVTRELACRLADEWKLEAIRAHHFGKLAARAGFDAGWGASLASQFAERIREAWPEVARDVGPPPEVAKRIEEHLARCKFQ